MHSATSELGKTLCATGALGIFAADTARLVQLKRIRRHQDQDTFCTGRWEDDGPSTGVYGSVETIARKHETFKAGQLKFRMAISTEYRLYCKYRDSKSDKTFTFEGRR